MKLVKRLYFCPDFCFLWIKCYFVITPMFTRMFTFWNVKSGFLTRLDWTKVLSKIGNSLHQFMHFFAQLVYTKSKPNFFDDPILSWKLLWWMGCLMFGPIVYYLHCNIINYLMIIFFTWMKQGFLHKLLGLILWSLKIK